MQAAQAEAENNAQNTEHDCVGCDEPEQSQSARGRIPQN